MKISGSNNVAIVLSQREQRKLVIHNAGLTEFARQQNFDVVDTFNMTMSRYKDFLQGKCACHFHRVSGPCTSDLEGPTW